jgi:HK97 family phage portal protein
MANDFFKNLTNNINKAFKVSPERGVPLPRKGLFAFNNTVLNKKQQKQFILNSETLKKLGNSDPISWAIRRTLKGFISNVAWDIVPDTDSVEAELDRWENLVLAYINPYGFDKPKFESELLNKELQAEVQHKVDTVMDDTSLSDSERRDRIRWVFKIMIRKVRDTAESHKYQVKKLFEHPSNTDSSFRLLLELLLEDLLVFDAGVLVKNYNYHGELAELYTIPGQEVKLYRNEDGTAPEPPEAAYAWEEKGVLRAEFANDELLYITQNPQHTGYGLSPMEVAAYVITASLYADEYNIDYFKHSNVPPGVLNLGENVTEDQRVVFQKMWENEVLGRGGAHKIVFAAGSDKMQFIPMRLQTNQDMQMMEYLKWTTSVKCACHGLSPQDIGFVLDFGKANLESQVELSKSRGVNNLLNLLSSYFNQEIVKTEFQFTDVKFAWNTEDAVNSIQIAQVDKIDIDTGVICINERREKLGLKPIEGGSEYTIKGAVGMLPVSDLDKLDEQKIDAESTMSDMGSEVATPGATATENSMQVAEHASSLPDNSNPKGKKSGDNKIGNKTGPKAETKVNGDAGRPTIHQQKKNENKLTIKVNRDQKVKDQYDQLNKTIDVLKQQGIDAELRIGFTDDTKKSAS